MFNGQKTGILIQARMGSKRLPGKAFAEIAGKPLLKRLCDRMRRCEQADEVVVATSDHPRDDIIANECTRWGVPVFRGAEKDLTARLLSAAKRYGLDFFVRVTGDNPLTDPRGVDELIQTLRREPAIKNKPVMVHNMHRKGYPYGTGAEAANRALLELCDRTLVSADDREYFARYAKEHPRQFRCRAICALPALRRPELFLTVDHPEDLELLRTIYEQVPGGDMELSEVIRFLDANPEIARMNAHLHKQRA